MRRRTLLLLLGAAALAAAVVATTASAGGPDRLTLAVYGDSPYLDPAFAALPHAELDATPAFIDTINVDKSIQEDVHVGDILGQLAVHERLRPVDLRQVAGVRAAADLHARRQRVERLHEGQGRARERQRRPGHPP